MLASFIAAYRHLSHSFEPIEHVGSRALRSYSEIYLQVGPVNERSLDTQLEVGPIALLIGQGVALVQASRIDDQGIAITRPNSRIIGFPPCKIIAMEQGFPITVAFAG